MVCLILYICNDSFILHQWTISTLKWSFWYLALIVSDNFLNRPITTGTLAEKQPSPFFRHLLVISNLYCRAFMDTSESRGLDFPVLHGVAEETHTRIASLFGVVAKRAKVVDTNWSDFVVMKIDHLKSTEVQKWETGATVAKKINDLLSNTWCALCNVTQSNNISFFPNKCLILLTFCNT